MTTLASECHDDETADLVRAGLRFYGILIVQQGSRSRVYKGLWKAASFDTGAAMISHSIKKLNSPWAVVLLVSVAYLVFLAIRLAQYGNDASRFIAAGDRYVDARQVPGNVYVQKGGDGYDGQFYFRLAVDPFITERTFSGITLDNPPYRYQRILYPLLIWALSLGNEEIVPELMIFVNYASLCSIGWAAGKYAQLFGNHALLGLSIPLYPGFLLCLSRDTSEILACCFVCWGLLLLMYNKAAISGMFFLASALTKETTVVFPLFYIVNHIFYMMCSRSGKETSIFFENKGKIFVFVLFAFVAWQALLFQIWGSLPLFSGLYNIGTPFLGIIDFFWSLLDFSIHPQRIWFIELLLLLLFIIAVLRNLRSSQATLEEKGAFILYMFLAVLLSRSVWIDDWAFLRATSELYLFGSIILISVSSHVGTAAGFCTVSLWLYMFYDILSAR
jgi:hypothetical protein